MRECAPGRARRLALRSDDAAAATATQAAAARRQPVCDAGRCAARRAAGAGKHADEDRVRAVADGEAIPPPPPPPPSRTAEAAATEAAAAAPPSRPAPPLWNAARRAGCPLPGAAAVGAAAPGCTRPVRAAVYPLVPGPASVDHGAAWGRPSATVGLGGLPDKLGGLHVALSARWLCSLPGQRRLLVYARLRAPPCPRAARPATAPCPRPTRRGSAKLRAHGIAHLDWASHVARAAPRHLP